jgi:hypothetical protein
MWELRPNLFIIPSKGSLKMKTIRYIRGYLTASNSSDIFSKGERIFSRKNRRKSLSAGFYRSSKEYFALRLAYLEEEL